MNSLVAVVALALACTAASPEREPTTATAKEKESDAVTLRLTVPREVASHAAKRMRGDASAPPPILVLQNLVVGAGEGFELVVAGPEGETLAVSGLVGERQSTLAQPVDRMTLVVPLNDDGARLVSEKTEVTLTLRVSDSPGRPRLEFEKAFMR